LRGAFTLVEVMVAVVLISVVGFALLQMQSNTIRSLSLIETRMEVNRYSSFIFGKIDKNLHGTKKDVYEYVKDRYNIKDDDLIKYLKKGEYEYRQDEVYFLHFGDGEDENQDEDGLVIDKAEDFASKDATDEVKRVGILVERVMIKDENNNSTSLYHFSFLTK